MNKGKMIKIFCLFIDFIESNKSLSTLYKILGIEMFKINHQAHR